MTKRVIARVVGSIITGVITIAALFFGILGVVALVTKQDYTTVMNAAFEWLKGLSNN
jgi:FtsH-binding integral membrane protein